MQNRNWLILLAAIMLIFGIGLFISGLLALRSDGLAAHEVEVPAPAIPTNTPAPDVRTTPVTLRSAMAESYCLWPGDTVSEVAARADIEPTSITAMNPDFFGHAGRAHHLPPNSIAPTRWTEPAPVVSAIEDLPFGESGYYIAYNNRRKWVSLTFDIGFVPRNEEVMKTLAARGIRATYFVLGEAMRRHPEVVVQILENGHELGNHSFTHENMQGMSELGMAAELKLTEEAVQAAVPGATTRPYFRAPFGAINERLVRVAREQGYHVVGWTVDSSDWSDGITADQIYEIVTTQVCPGAIIAMHDVNPANYAALPRILDFLEESGYEFVPVSAMLTPGG